MQKVVAFGRISIHELLSLPRFFLAAALCLAVQSGCTGGKRADGKIVIEYWHQPMVSVVPGKEEITREPGDFERYLAEEFMREHPNVIVRTQCLNWEDLPRKVPASIIAGSPPDVLQDFLGRTSGYWHQKVLEPVDRLVSRERDDFHPAMLDDYTIHGQLHAVPLFRWAQVMALNRAIWERAGKADLLPSLDQPYWDFAQFEHAIQAVAVPNKLYPLGVQVASEQGDYGILQFFWAMGAKVYENRRYDRVRLNSPAGVKALSWLVESHKRGLIQPAVTTILVNELYDMFWRGEIALMPRSISLIRLYKNALRDGRVSADVDIMFTLPPTAPGVQLAVPFGSSGLAVFKQTDPKKRKAVEQFVRFHLRPEVLRDFCLAAYQFPSRRSVGELYKDQPELALLQKQIESSAVADMGLTSPHYYEIRKLLPPQLQAAFLGIKSPAEALADFERQAQAVLSR